jgi:hypothetical protein
VESIRQKNLKYNKTTILAWILFGAISLLTFLSLITLPVNREANRPLLSIAGDLAWVLVPAAFAFIAALILARQPRNSIGWLLMLPAIALASSNIFQNFIGGFTAAPIAPTPAFLLALWFYSWNWLLLMFPIFFIFLFFPTGQPASPRWRWAVGYILVVCALCFLVIAFSNSLSPQDGNWMVANPVGFIPDGWFMKYFTMPFAIGLLSTTVLCVISMVVRYRRAQPVEREQIKWLLYACAGFAATYILTILFNLNNQQWGAEPGWIYLLNAFGVMSMPIAIGIAILRYRLWDIDVIIRKTLIYAALSVTLALVFFGIVILLQQVLGTFIGMESSPIAIVVSTLAIAALFTPLRNRIQRDIDRHFFRKKYDAQKTLEGFAASVRNEVELENLTTRLLAVVQETIQPESVRLWLKPTDRR